MSVKRTARVVSVINIGSNFVYMGVYQMQRNAPGVQQLDYLEAPLRLGYEVFATGRISLQSVRQLSSILRGFSQVMKEYGVSEYRAIATTAVREAKNRAYVLDQLRIQNNLTVEVLEDGEECAFIYSALSKTPQMREQTLLSYVGTGSVGLAAWRDGAVEHSCNLTMGFLKLSQMLRGEEDQTTHFYQVLEEYIEADFHQVALQFGGQTFPRILLAGRRMGTMVKLCGAKEAKGALVVERSQIEKIYNEIKEKSAASIAQTYGLREDVAEQVVPMLAIYRQIMAITGAKKLVAPPVNLMETLAAQLLLPDQQEAFEAVARQSAIASARYMAKSERVNTAHGEQVRAACVMLFHKLKKLHGISAKQLVLLECAALLHEVGESANVRDTALASYDWVKQSHIFGLNEQQMQLVAEIIRRSIGMRPGQQMLTEKRSLLVDKLAAMMGLADALDATRSGRVQQLKVRLEPERMVVTAESRSELLLEKWAFRERSAFFEEAFGIQAVLVHKSTLL